MIDDFRPRLFCNTARTRDDKQPSIEARSPKFTIGTLSNSSSMKTIPFTTPSVASSLSKINIGLSSAELAQKPASGNIKIFARFRPFTSQQTVYCTPTTSDLQSYLQFLDNSTVKVVVNQPAVYTLDQVFPPQTDQKSVFNCIEGKNIVSEVLNGFNATVLAYGQTGSGKTHTMFGDSSKGNQAAEAGVIPRSMQYIFHQTLSQFFATLKTKQSSESVESAITCSFFEIYQQNVIDLLTHQNSQAKELKIKQNPKKGLYVQGLCQFSVTTEAQLLRILELGQINRKTATTKVNQRSSRSHTIFKLQVRLHNTITSTMTEGCLSLVDLAGSEKVNKTRAQGVTLEEAKKINFSLSCLGNVIHAITNGNDYIPYRDSKLTRILSDSLGGNCKTSMIVTCSPHPRNIQETASTLKFATRAKLIKNTFRQNKQLGPDDVQKVLSDLRMQLAEAHKEIALNREINQHSPIPARSHESESTQTVTVSSNAKQSKNPFAASKDIYLNLRTLSSGVDCQIEELRRENSKLRLEVVALKRNASLQPYLQVKIKQYETQLQKLKNLYRQLEQAAKCHIKSNLGAQYIKNSPNSQTAHLLEEIQMQNLLGVLPQNISESLHKLHKSSPSVLLELVVIQACVNQHLETPRQKAVVSLQDKILRNNYDWHTSNYTQSFLLKKQLEIQKQLNNKMSNTLEQFRKDWDKMSSIVTSLQDKLALINGMAKHPVVLDTSPDTAQRMSSKTRNCLENINKNKRTNHMFRFNHLVNSNQL